MPNAQRLKLLHLSDILFKYTDEKHYLSTTQIIKKLAALGVEVTRQTLKQDIELLKQYGLDITEIKSSVNKYALSNRDFEIPELKMIIDTIEASHFLTERKTKLLISKIGKLSSVHQAKYLNGQSFTDIKNTNEKIFINVDRIYKAIFYKYKVSFNYIKYSIDKKHYNKRNGETYVVSPYDIIYKNDNYYLIAHHPRYDNIVNFRIDKITNINVLKNESIIPPPKDFNEMDYINKMFDMYPGKIKEIELKFDMSLLDTAIDKFGEKVLINKFDDNHFIIKTSISVSPPFYAWIFMFGKLVEILSPMEVIEEFIRKKNE